MKRYEKFVFEAKKGMNNVFSELPTVSVGEYAEVLSVYTDKAGNNAVVPPGWTVSGLEDENSIERCLVIYQIPQEKVNTIDWSNMEEVSNLQKTYNQLSWCPYDFLLSHGMIENFASYEKYWKENALNNDFFEDAYHETYEYSRSFQADTIKKYGGFYLTRFDISINKETGKPMSIKSAIPFKNSSLTDAIIISTIFENNDTVISYLFIGLTHDLSLKLIQESFGGFRIALYIK